MKGGKAPGVDKGRNQGVIDSKSKIALSFLMHYHSDPRGTLELEWLIRAVPNGMKCQPL